MQIFDFLGAQEFCKWSLIVTLVVSSSSVQFSCKFNLIFGGAYRPAGVSCPRTLRDKNWLRPAWEER